MPTIHIAGDSTAANKKAEARPETGWGEKLADFFTSDVTIKNHAVNGRSTKSFIEEGRLDDIEKELQPGDYLFVQFGHNDQKKDDSNRYTDPDSTYLFNLRQFLEVAQKKQAQLVCLTSVTRRDFDLTGRLKENTLGLYPERMRQFAANHQLPLLDLFAATQQYFNDLGPEASKTYYMNLAEGEFANYPNGKKDDTHFQEKGARAVAKLVVEAIQQAELDLTQYLKAKE